jgi:hypothetical protein
MRAVSNERCEEEVAVVVGGTNEGMEVPLVDEGAVVEEVTTAEGAEEA